METIQLKISGMSCGHCVRSVRDALGKIDGVQTGEVEVGAATVSFDPAVADEARIVQAVLEEGYTARVAARSK